MEIKAIKTKRQLPNLFYWDLVFEWEDELLKRLGCKFINESWLYEKHKVLKLGGLISRFQTREPTFLFEMGAYRYRVNNRANIVPCIIDLYPNFKKLLEIEKGYSRNKLLLISSREAYEYLNKISFPLNIGHLPLSLPDKYGIDDKTKYTKDIDLVQCGRANPILLSWTEQYAETHPGFVYAYRKWEPPHNVYYLSDGRRLGIFDSRKEYFSLIRRAKISIYTTSGMDDDKKTNSNFHQVTPRLLELISSGCQLLCRYEENADTDYYELNKICPHLSSYQEFEMRLDMYRNKDADMSYYSNYLKKHYTSTRANTLSELVKSI